MESYTGFSKIYDKLIMEDVDYDAFASFILSMKQKGRSYLDAACGTGNISLRIAPHFRDTTLIDLSEDMLTLAVQKLDSLGIRTRAYSIPMEDMQFEESFSLITSVLDSVNYLTEHGQAEKFFKAAYDHLEEGGLFVFDINSSYKLTEILGDNDYVYTSDDIVYTWENSLEDGIVEMYLNFFIREGKHYERVEELHHEKVFSEQELIDILHRTGFEDIETWDSYSEKRPDEETERITFTAWKRRK